MDYVDCVQVHSPCIEAVGFDGAMKIHAELVKLRDEKLLRFIGLTTHVAFETVLRMIKTDGFDQVLLAYGYVRKGMDTMLSNPKVEYRDRCLAAAHERGMAIVAMKVLGANMLSHNAKNMVADYDAARLEQIPPAAIRWVLQDDARVDAEYRRLDAQRHRQEPGRGARRHDVHQRTIATCWPTSPPGSMRATAGQGMPVTEAQLTR